MTKDVQFLLSRMILVNVYGKGAITEMKLDGHTALTGRNGFGKTSLLRLIPVFYGESPNKLTHSGGGATRSFVDYYLPHTNSFIVYEYNRKGKWCIAVLHASSAGDSVCYRLIDQPFALERFTNGQGELIDGVDLYRHIKKRGEFCSAQLSIKEYKEIIQNTASGSNRENARNFSFVESGARLTHMEKIVTGMFSRATRFSDIRKIIASCVEDETVTKLGTRKAALDAWIHDYEAYQRVMECAPDMRSAVDLAVRHRENIQQLRRMRRDFLRSQHGLEADIRKTGDAVRTIQNTLDEKEQRHNQEVQRLSGSIGEAEGHAHSVQKALDQLQNQWNDYEKQDISTLAHAVDALPQARIDLHTKKDKREILIGDFNNISKRFEDLIQARKTDFFQQQIGWNDTRQTMQADIDQAKEQVRRDAEDARKTLKEEMEQQEAALRTVRETLIKRESEAKFAAQYPQCSAEADRIRDQARQTRDTALSKAKASKLALEAANTAHHEAIQQLQEIDQQIQTALRQKEETIEKRSRLLLLKDAKPGTLLHFLREQRPGWTRDIAKVIPQNLLLREDLAPTLVQENQEGLSLFGVGLDLSVIDAPMVVDEGRLQQEMNRLNQQIDAHQNVADAKNRELEQQRHRVTEALNAVKDLEVQRAKDQGAANAAEEALKAAERARLSEIEQSRHQAQLAMESVQQELRQHSQEETRLQMLRKDRERQQEDNLRQQLDALTAKMQREIEVLDDLAASAKASLERITAELEVEREQALKNQQVDTASLQRLESEIRQSEADIQKAQSYEQRVLEWRHWLRIEWESRPRKESELQKAKSRLEELVHQRDKLLQDHRHQCETLRQEIETARKEQTQLEKNRGFTLSRLATMRLYEPEMEDQGATESLDADADLPLRPLAVLEVEMNRLTTALQEENVQIKKLLPSMLSAFSATPGTGPYRFYESRHTFMGSLSDPGVLPYWKWVPVLREWFDTEHEVARRIMMTQCQNLSASVSEYHTKIKSIQRRVSLFASDLQKNIASSSRFRSIHRIDVDISTTLDSLDGWDDIRQMSELFDLWSDGEKNALPDEAFVSAVRKVSAWLNGRQSTEVKLENLLELSVEIEEVGQPKKVVRNENDLANVSSTGLSYLILCVILVGLINKIRAGQSVQMLWALDELTSLDRDNTHALLQMLSDHHIHLVSAFPNADPEILEMTKHSYQIREDRRLAQFKKEVAHVL
ncbi:MAG: ATP-binding protein [Acidithiobacillus sp.]|nr:ATP-binding protein [Acidithiobacillus sp.]